MTYFSRNMEPAKTKTQMLAQLKREGIEPVKSRIPMKNTLEYWLPAGTRVIRLHETDILAFHPNGAFTINTGGFNTPVTRSRLNLYLPFKYGVFTESAILHLTSPERPPVPFASIVEIGAMGKVTPDKSPAQLKGDRKRIDSFMKQIKLDGLPSAANSEGDPWIFSPAQVTESTMWDWLDTGYFTRRFYALALEYAGLAPMGIGYYMSDAEKRGLDSLDLRRIRRYIRSRVGLAV